ncbi:hypothetical protein MSAN_01763100 [Mycena sanguinolenta]|uniref:Uncharacterized protein n=1 Tax=Mycena sanguinolenta TaxID=230812 RepID=A0A8H6XU06_9AGAR|nr:hypothetical protein MSAN_01763100 [Mycena sanguinolenta]
MNMNPKTTISTEIVLNGRPEEVFLRQVYYLFYSHRQRTKFLDEHSQGSMFPPNLMAPRSTLTQQPTLLLRLSLVLTYFRWSMFFPSASSRLVWLLTLLAAYIPSVLVLHVERTLERRDAFSDSGLSLASWIWLPEPDLQTTAPTGSIAFLQTLTSPAGKNATSASIAITADNNFTLWVNGQPIGASDGTVTDVWTAAQVFTAALNASVNVFSVLGSNTGTVTPNPAGLLAAISLLFTDGTTQMAFSDNTWIVSATIPSDFPSPHDLSSFVQAEVAATYGSGPWGTGVTIPASDLDPLSLTGSAWIWSTANASVSAAIGSVGFRKTVTSPAGNIATSATVLLTADNTFQLFINSQYIGAPPVDSNTAGAISSWEYAQLFTDVALMPTTNVFTVLATNFAATSTANDPSSAGIIAALQITFSDGTTEVVRTDTTWLAGTYTSAPTFLDATDSVLVAAVSSGLFGIPPWGTLRGTSDALSALTPSANIAAVIPSGASPPQTVSDPLPAPTSVLPDTPSMSSAVPPTASGSNSARASVHSQSILVSGLSILIFHLL